ncbi:MFS transporter [Streptomyces sp. NPDC056519]|uniref:MFS transporter n=1 Tax=Streptomyces sp. NPDC056519 TaxID=3345849 RepID=UPI0036C1AF28
MGPHRFMLAFVGLLPVAGWLADAHGRPRTAIQGMAVFLVGSIGCALAPDAAWLVAGRVLPGAGGALVAPGSDATIAGVFHGRCKSVAFGFVMGAAGAGAALGPVVGGQLAELGWRYVFLVNVPVGLLAIPLIHRCVRPARDPVAAARRAPLLSACAVVLGSAAITLAIDRGAAWGWLTPGRWGELVRHGRLPQGRRRLPVGRHPARPGHPRSFPGRRHVKVNQHRPVVGKVKTISVKREGKR